MTSLSDEEFADLAERTQQLVELSQSYPWKLFEDRAHAEVVRHQRAILAGRMTPDDYHRECGWVAGAIDLLGLPARATEELRVNAAHRAEAADEEETLA